MTQTPEPVPTNEQRAADFIAAFQSLRSEVRKVIVGHDDVINHVLISLFAGGHVLLEGRARPRQDAPHPHAGRRASTCRSRASSSPRT